MKNYFDFTLTGKKMFPIWILFMATVILPYVLMLTVLIPAQPGEKPSPLIFLFLLEIVLMAIFISYFFRKISIENIAFKGVSSKFNGTFGSYVGKVLLGIFLSIITLGIYSPWFIKSLETFYAENTTYDGKPFKFNGTGLKLFLIITFTYILPIISLTVITASFGLVHPENLLISQFVSFILIFMIAIAMIYLVYKWSVDFEFDGFKVLWETGFLAAYGKIALEIFLILITLGIYLPMAELRLYKYFVDRTIATSENSKVSFGFELDSLKDFLTIWGQWLLTIITFGIYYPWAYAKIGKLCMSKTFMTE